MSSSYQDVVSVYKALVDPEAVKGRVIGNRVIAERIAALPENAHVLDAACGLGWDAIAVMNGLPGVLGAGAKRFNVAASDIDAAMVAQARKNAESFPFRAGVKGEIDIRHGAFADLAGFADWRRKFDAIFASYAIYTYPEGMAYGEYDDYFVRSLESLKALLKQDGVIWLDNRDWESLFRRVSTAQYETTHDGETYVAEYRWTFGDKVESAHHAGISMWNAARKDDVKKLEVNYAGKTLAGFEELIGRAGFTVSETVKPSGKGEEGFITYGLTVR